MAGIARTIDLTEFIKEMEFRAREAGNVSYRKPLKISQVLIVADAKENFAGARGPDGQAWKPLAHPRAGGQTDGKPLRDKGLLMASITSTTGARNNVSEITDTYLLHGTNLEYARIHQEGGTIVPKSAKALAIPLTRDADRAGYARDFPRPLFIIESDSGKAFLAETKAKGKGKKSFTELIFHYILVDRVIIPARPFLGFSKKVIDQINEVFKDFWDGLMAGKKP